MSLDEYLVAARRALAQAGGDGASVLLWNTRRERTQFKYGSIFAETLEESRTLFVRVQSGAREAVGSTTTPDDDSVRRLAENLMAGVEHGAAAAPLPGPQRYAEVEPFEVATALWAPGQRAAGVSAVLELAASAGLSAFGEYFTTVEETAVVNTAGVEVVGARSLAGLSVWAEGGGLASYGSGYARDAAQLNPIEIVETAIAKAMPLPYADPPRAGAYPAVLEPSATADLLAYLARDARVFSADERQGGLGLRLAPGEDAELVSLLEDPLSPDGLLSPFDAEGVARRAVPVVSRGKVGDLVHDMRTAAQAGVSSTGHAAHPAAALGATGPTPCSIFMEHGEGELEGMIAATGDGLLLSRLTGLTPVGRDGGLVSGVATGGVFRIQSGIVTHRLPDLPFVASVTALLAAVRSVSRERKLMMYGERRDLAVVAPAVRVSAFPVVAPPPAG